MEDILIFYNYIGKNSPENIKNKIQFFPEKLKTKINKYSLEEDRQMRISSKLLLLKAIEKISPTTKDVLVNLKYNNYSKPFLNIIPLQFSVAHSSGLVVLAIHRNYKIGIDLEIKKSINTSELNPFLHPNEKIALHHSENQSIDFLKFWTRKEAVQKASGKGIELPLEQIDTTQSTISVENQLYHIQTLLEFEGFITSLVSEKPISYQASEVLF